METIVVRVIEAMRRQMTAHDVSSEQLQELLNLIAVFQERESNPLLNYLYSSVLWLKCEIVESV